MTRIIGYTALHYGSCYLPWAIRSIIAHIDEYHVLYSANGSHGTRSSVPLPESESRENLHRLAKAAAGDKLRWHDGDWLHEGQQRDTIYELAPDADMILVLDYDEIWTDTANVIDIARRSGVGKCRLTMFHFWRSFNWAILRDPAFPVRILQPKLDNQSEQLITNPYAPNGSIAHLGYAIPDTLMAYKRPIHGHKNEWRTDIDWWQDRWQNPIAIKDLHPVGSEYWNVETIDPASCFPDYMKLHPFWGLDRIT